MRPLLAGLMTVIMLLSACTQGGPSTVSEAAPPPSLNPEALAPRPDGVVWTRQAHGVEIVGLTANADPAELMVIEAALSELHPAVVDASQLRLLVRSDEPGEGEIEVGGAVAFSLGPDVWLVDATFSEVTEPAGRLGTARVLAHEMAHTAQFAELRPDLVATGGSIDMATGSALVADYAEAVGWERSDSGWTLARPGGTTEYGRTGPQEDMAESLSMLALGRAEALSIDRIEWLEAWLGVSADELAEGKPWFPPEGVQFISETAIYDEDRVRAFGRTHIEPTYLELPLTSPAADQLASSVASELRSRSFTGTLELVDDPRLPRYHGRFIRPDGVNFWVEVWDFRLGPGFSGDVPDGPVLTYVMLW